MTEKEIAIGLYREGFSRRQIRRKLEINGATMAEYLVDEPKRPRKRRVAGKPPVYKPSPAKLRGEALIKKGLPVDEIHRMLVEEGLQASRSTICRWRLDMKGRIKQRVPASDYPVLRNLILANAGVTGLALSKLYHEETGRRMDRRAASYWCRKVRRAA